jgi:hypothetical protein
MKVRGNLSGRDLKATDETDSTPSTRTASHA